MEPTGRLSTGGKGSRAGLSPETRAALKQQQLARLEAKVTLSAEEYSALYSQQPAQIRRKAENDMNGAARRAIKAQAQQVATEDAKAAAEVFSGAIPADTEASK